MNNLTLGQKIKYYRSKAKYSQFDLEIAINASAGSISRIEHNLVNPTKETLCAISKALNLNENEKADLFGIEIFEADNEYLNIIVEKVLARMNQSSSAI